MRPSAAQTSTAQFALALAFVVALVILALLCDELAPPPTTLSLLAALLVAACVTWNIWVAGASASSPSTLYLAALCTFHLGLVVPWTAGLTDAPPWLATVPDPLLSRALLCVLLAVCCLQGGLLTGWSRRPARRWRRVRAAASVLSHSARQPPRGPSALHSGGLLVAAVAAGAVLVNVLSIGAARVLSASYGYELYASTDSRLLQTGLFWLLPAALVVSFASARAGVETKRALALSAALVALLFWAGDRGGAVALTAAELVVWTYARGPIPRRVLLPIVLGILLVMPAVAALRQLPRNGIDVAALAEAAAAASPLSALTEMGGSLRPLVETLWLVPAEFPYRYGDSYLAAASRVVPNLGLTRAEFDWTDPATLPPNHWITFTVAPWTYAAFGGLGFSAVAEPYLNFGLAGIAGYFVGLGFVLARVERQLTLAPTCRRLALAAVVFMPLLLTVRNDFHGFARSAAWGVGMVLLLERVHGARAIEPGGSGLPRRVQSHGNQTAPTQPAGSGPLPAPEPS